MESYYAHIENNTRRLKLINQRFGRLLVLEYIGLDKRGNSIWKCQCDCGNVKNIKGGSLQQKRTKSCGCLKGEITAEKWRNSTHSRIKKGQSGRNALFSRYKISAKKRNLEFNLTKEESIKRNSSRRICKKNRHPIPGFPQYRDLMTCPEDGSPIIRRELDKPEIIKERYRVYKAETEPVLDYLKKNGYDVITIEGEQPIEKVQEDILKYL